MKQLLPLLFSVFVLVGVGHSQNCNPKSTYDSFFGNLADTRFSSINCHQYVRTALLNGGVNMNDGTFIPRPNISSDGSWISTDDQFVEVCRKEYAEAINFSGLRGQPDHSVLVLSAGLFSEGLGSMASTPGPGSYVYRHGVAGALSGGGTRFEYYAVLPEISGPLTLEEGEIGTYQINWKDYIQGVVWSVNSGSSLSIVGSNNGQSVNVEADCSDGSGNYELYATITIKDSEETIMLTMSISVDCGAVGNSCYGNELNGGPLYTFNSVAPNTTNTVIMNMPWSWNLSWGNPSSWNTSNNGQTMTFSLSPGSCATWTASNSTCGINTYTFCATSAFGPFSGETDAIQAISGDTPFEVYDLLSGRLVDRGFMEVYGNQPQNLIQNLPNGFYAIRIKDRIYKVSARN